jgi:hypothetical protein
MSPETRAGLSRRQRGLLRLVRWLAVEHVGFENLGALDDLTCFQISAVRDPEQLHAE